jgi:hypothetical protein
MTVQQALAGFDEIYSPRIVARVNNYDVRVAHTRGEHVWHVHDDTDEFFLALDGQFDIALRDGHGGELEPHDRLTLRRYLCATASSVRPVERGGSGTHSRHRPRHRSPRDDRGDRCRSHPPV